MTRFRLLLPVLSLCLVSLVPAAARAACVNKYVAQKSANRVTMTLLTGMLNFDDAKKLAEAIGAGEHPPLVWLDADGKVISKQFGALKVVRPMPVACEGKSSGVVVQVVFIAIQNPTRAVLIQFDPNLVVEFEPQNN